MKKIKLTSQDLKTIEIQTYAKGGFVVWIIEKVKVGSKYRDVRHWIVDASTFHKNGLVRFGSDVASYNIKNEFDPQENAIKIFRVDKTRKRKKSKQ